MARSSPALHAIHTVACDFDGVFTDNKVWVDQSGHESVRCDRADGLAFDLVRAFERRGRIAAEWFILSKESNPVVLERARKLRLTCHHGISNKVAFMESYLDRRFPLVPDTWAGVVYLGNDLNDVPVIRRAGYAVAPADAHPKVRQVADLVLPQCGGAGFVRAFVERLLGLDGLSAEEMDELVSDC